MNDAAADTGQRNVKPVNFELHKSPRNTINNTDTYKKRDWVHVFPQIINMTSQDKGLGLLVLATL
jgi:hypothetical protein